jgi:hypothetical protein
VEPPEQRLRIGLKTGASSYLFLQTYFRWTGMPIHPTLYMQTIRIYEEDPQSEYSYYRCP